MLPAIRQDLTLAQGDTLALVATVAEDAFGNAVSSATGWQLVVAVKASLAAADSAALVTADHTNQTIVGNTIEQALSTAALVAGTTYVYDARLIDPSNRVFTYQYGELFIVQPVTDSPSTL